MMSKEAKAAYARGYDQGRKDLVTVVEWLHEWHSNHPDASEEEAEAAFLSTPLADIFGERKAV